MHTILVDFFKFSQLIPLQPRYFIILTGKLIFQAGYPWKKISQDTERAQLPAGRRRPCLSCVPIIFENRKVVVFGRSRPRSDTHLGRPRLPPSQQKLKSSSPDLALICDVLQERFLSSTSTAPIFSVKGPSCSRTSLSSFYSLTRAFRPAEAWPRYCQLSIKVNGKFTNLRKHGIDLSSQWLFYQLLFQW